MHLSVNPPQNKKEMVKVQQIQLQICSMIKKCFKNIQSDKWGQYFACKFNIEGLWIENQAAELKVLKIVGQISLAGVKIYHFCSKWESRELKSCCKWGSKERQERCEKRVLTAGYTRTTFSRRCLLGHFPHRPPKWVVCR